MFVSPIKSQLTPNRLKKHNGTTYKTNNIKTNRFTSDYLNIKALYNKNLLSFKGIEHDDYGYSAFINASKNILNSVEDVEKNICDENLLGSGANSYVYKFTDERLDKWVLKKNKLISSVGLKDKLFEQVDDEFENINVGQKIAQIGNKYEILKKIEGKAHSVNNWSYHINNESKVTYQEAKDFLEELEQISQFPQSSFDDYAKKLALIDKYGYKQDSINPNNLLIDYDTQTINIIDFFKEESDNPKQNTVFDLTSCLLDFALFEKLYDKLNDTEQKQLREIAHKIIQKCKIAGNKSNIKDNKDEYIRFIKHIDSCFGSFFEAGQEMNYLQRYEAMEKILHKE